MESPDDPTQPITSQAEITADVSTNWCDDVRSESEGTVIRFDFAVTPPTDVVRTMFLLRIRNSVPGDVCGGRWNYHDDAGTLLISGGGNGLSGRQVGDGWSAILEITDPVTPDGNCTTDGVVLNADDDPGWVISSEHTGGKPLKGTQLVEVTWTPWNPPGS